MRDSLCAEDSLFIKSWATLEIPCIINKKLYLNRGIEALKLRKSLTYSFLHNKFPSVCEDNENLRKKINNCVWMINTHTRTPTVHQQKQWITKLCEMQHEYRIFHKPDCDNKHTVFRNNERVSKRLAWKLTYWIPPHSNQPVFPTKRLERLIGPVGCCLIRHNW